MKEVDRVAFRVGPFLRMSGTALQPIVWAALLVYIAIPLGIVLFVLPRIGVAGPLAEVAAQK